VNLIGGEMKCLGELVADAEGTLSPGPDGEARAVPLRDGGTWFKRCVGDVLDGVLLVDTGRRGGQFLFDGAGGRLRSVAGIRAVLDELEKLAVGELRGDAPLGAEDGDGALGSEGIGRNDADEVTVVDELDAGEFFRGAGVERNKRGVVAGGAQDRAEEHVFADDV
jgi:hypothetical protein